MGNSSSSPEKSKSEVVADPPTATEKAKKYVEDVQSSIRRTVILDDNNPVTQYFDTLCGPVFDDEEKLRRERSYAYSEDMSEEDSRTVSDSDTLESSYQRGRRGGKGRSTESGSVFSQSDYESETTATKSTIRGQSRSFESEDDKTNHLEAPPTTSAGLSKPLASSFAKRCYFTKAGIGKTTQHYEGLTLTGNVVLMLAAAMKLKGCPTICDEDLRRVEQTYPNQFSRLPDELLLSSGWRRISKYCHFSNKPIPDGVPFFHSKQRVHPTGGYYFLLAAAVGMIRPIDVEPLTRDTLVLLETDFPNQCDAAPTSLIQDPNEWTLVDKFCFFSGGPINTEEDVYYQADFDGNPIFMLAFLSPSLTPEELYKLNGDLTAEPELKNVADVENVESVYDLTERDFDDLKLYHLGPCRALPPYVLQPQAWTKVLPPHFLTAKHRAGLRAQQWEDVHGVVAPSESMASTADSNTEEFTDATNGGFDSNNAYDGAQPQQYAGPQPAYNYGNGMPSPMQQSPMQQQQQQMGMQGMSPVMQSSPGMLPPGMMQQQSPAYYQSPEVNNMSPHILPMQSPMGPQPPHMSPHGQSPHGPFYANSPQSATYQQHPVQQPQYPPQQNGYGAGYYQSPSPQRQPTPPRHPSPMQQRMPSPARQDFVDMSQGPPPQEYAASHVGSHVGSHAASHVGSHAASHVGSHAASHVGSHAASSSHHGDPRDFGDMSPPRQQSQREPSPRYDVGISQSTATNSIDAESFQREVEEEGAFMDNSIPMDEAMALRKNRQIASPSRNPVSPPGYRSETPKMDPPDDEPPSLSRDDIPDDEKFQQSSYYSGQDTPGSGGSFHFAASSSREEYYSSPDKTDNKGRQYYSSREEEYYDSPENHGGSTYQSQNGSEYYEENSRMQQSPDYDPQSPEYSEKSGKEYYTTTTAEGDNYRSPSTAESGEYHRSPSTAGSDTEYHQSPEQTAEASTEYYRSPETGDSRSAEYYQSPETGDSGSADYYRSPTESGSSYYQPERDDTENEPPVEPSPKSEVQSSTRSLSEYSQSSAMRTAQDLLKRNRQRRIAQERSKKQEFVPEDGSVASQNSEWESGSEMTSVISGSSVWTDTSNPNDRSSRRALILQMAKARMKQHKSSDSVQPIREEELEVSTRGDTNNIDLTEELD